MAALVSVSAHAKTLRAITRALAVDPHVLVTGPTSNRPSLDRFVRALGEAGSTVIRNVHPECVRCGHRRKGQSRSGTGWACRACMQDGVVCGDCGVAEGVQVRSVDGQPRCTSCARAMVRREQLEQINAAIRALVHGADTGLADAAVDAAIVKTAWTIPKRGALLVALDDGPPLNGAAFRSAPVARLINTLRQAGSLIPAALCDSCTGPAEPLIASLGPVRCRACAKICPTCGRATKDVTHQTCRRCATPAGRVRGSCVDCTRDGLLLDNDDRCRRCREAVVRVCVTCNSQATLTDGRCHRCLLTEEFDQILGEHPSPWLVALRSSVLKTANATSAQRWLHHTTNGRLLMSMARGELPLSHDTLDPHTGRGIDHLRGLLITAGGLEPELRWIDQLGDELHVTLTILDDQRDRKVVGAWIRWHALPRLRRRAERGASTAHSGANLRRQAQHVMSFVAGIEHRKRTLMTCTQSDIDQWFARPGAAPEVVRSFLTWTAKHKHTPRHLTLPRSRQSIGSGPVDSERRWQIARVLVANDSVADSDRVAGALLVLYAQSLTRIAALTIDDDLWVATMHLLT